MHEYIAESEWVTRFVDEALRLIPYLGRERVTAAARFSYVGGTVKSPEIAALAYLDTVVDRILHPPH
jgi:hypothetical protein